MLNGPVMIKNQEYELLDAIAQDAMVTQASLSARLGIAVGSVNWYIKRLINCGYVKVSHLDRTRLKYQLTPEGMSILTQRTLQYLKRSLTVYNELRQKAKAMVADLRSQGVTHVYLEGDDELMDILRLTCIEAGMSLDERPDGTVLKAVGHDYQVVS
ncbi:MAG: winged helix-turn-helix transcriptional regulator [Chloroflexota bacterium]